MGLPWLSIISKIPEQRVNKWHSESGFWQKTLIYFSALIVNIVLGWILVKINTHFLSVEAYGQYSFFVIFLFMSRTFFGFGLYESTSRQLALSWDERDRRQLTGTVFLWSLAFYLLFALFFLLVSLIIDLVFEVKIGELVHRFAWLSGLVLLHTFFLLAIRGYGKMNLMAEATIYPRIFYIALLIPVILGTIFTTELTIAAMFGGYAITIIITFIRLSPEFSSVRVQSRRLLGEIRSYGIHMYIGAIWQELLFHFDKLVISFFLDDRSIAYYALAYMLTFPLSHFSTALATGLYRKFSKSEMIERWVFMVNFLFVISSVLIFIILRKTIILRLFSADYMPSVELIIPLAMAFGLSGISKPVTLFLVARGFGKIIRNISVVVPTVQIVITLLVVPKFGIIGAAWCTFSVYFLDLLLNILAYRRLRS